jgi:hypothetical protein
VNESDGQPSNQRRVLRDATTDKTTCLDEVSPSPKRIDHLRNRCRIILVVPIYGDDVLVAIVERDGVTATQLATQPARTEFCHHPSDATRLKVGGVETSVAAAPVNQNYVGDPVNSQSKHPFNKGSNPNSLVDDWYHDTGVMGRRTPQVELESRNLPDRA